MYKISVPIMSTTVNMSNREEYVRQFREVGAERVFIALGTPLLKVSIVSTRRMQLFGYVLA